MPIKKPFPAIPFFLIVLAARVFADSVVLKSGERIEGRIMEESGTELRVSIQVSPTIQDERVIRKTDIESIGKLQPDEEAWMHLAGVEPGPDSLERDDYTRALNRLGEFLNAHPNSARATLARERREQFKADLERVEAGDWKMDGKWIDRKTASEERIQLGGRSALKRMRAQASAGHLIEALNTFDYLEKKLAGSESYPEAVSLARTTLAALKSLAEQEQVRLGRRARDEKQRLQFAQGAERTQLEASLAAERKAVATRVAALEQSGLKWLPLRPSTDRGLASLLAKISAEAIRLDGIPVGKMMQSIKAAGVAAIRLEQNDIGKAGQMLDEAATSWPANERVTRLKRKLADARAAEEAARKAVAARATPVPPPKIKPTPAPQPVEVTRVVVPEPDKIPFTRQPVFYVCLIALLAFAGLGVKAYRKIQGPQNNILDR